MTCGSCKASVENSLNGLDEVTNAVVNLEKEEAIVTMNSPIEVETLQKVLPSKYTISMNGHKNVFASTQNSGS